MDTLTPREIEDKRIVVLKALKVAEKAVLKRLQKSILMPGTEEEKLERSKLCGISRRKINSFSHVIGCHKRKTGG